MSDEQGERLYGATPARTVTHPADPGMTLGQIIEQWDEAELVGQLARELHTAVSQLQAERDRAALADSHAKIAENLARDERKRAELAERRYAVMRRAAARKIAVLTERLEYARVERAEAAGPALVYSSNSEAGDGQHACSVCGQERDEPHTWQECARLLRRSHDALVNQLWNAGNE